MSTAGGVYAALETAQEQENIALREELYPLLRELQLPWAAANMLGFFVILAAFVGLVTVLRTPK